MRRRFHEKNYFILDLIGHFFIIRYPATFSLQVAALDWIRQPN